MAKSTATVMGCSRPRSTRARTHYASGDGWLPELKHDGYLVALKDGKRVRLWSRNGRDWSGGFTTVTAAVMALPFARIILDAEAVARA